MVSDTSLILGNGTKSSIRYFEFTRLFGVMCVWARIVGGTEWFVAFGLIFFVIQRKPLTIKWSYTELNWRSFDVQVPQLCFSSRSMHSCWVNGLENCRKTSHENSLEDSSIFWQWIELFRLHKHNLQPCELAYDAKNFKLFNWHRDLDTGKH